MKFRKLKVTMHLRSGNRLVFLADKITKTFEGNELTALKAEGSLRWPFYVRLDQIEAVTDRGVWGFWL